MKIIPSIIAVCILIIFIQNVTAADIDTPPIEYRSFTETAGKNIADQQAKTWRDDAELIRVTVPNSTLVENGATIDYYTTEFCYIYRSGDKYLFVLINLEEYENGTARTEEISSEYAEKLGFNSKIPLADWKVLSRNAFKIALDSYKDMSLDRGDVIGRICLENAEINGANTPVWNVSIKSGITGLDTNYTINAYTAEILIPNSTKEIINSTNGSNDGESSSGKENIWQILTLLITLLPVVMSIIQIVNKDMKRKLKKLLKSFIKCCENSNDFKIEDLKIISAAILKILNEKPELLANENIKEVYRIGEGMKKLAELKTDTEESVLYFYERRSELVKQAKSICSKL